MRRGRRVGRLVFAARVLAWLPLGLALVIVASRERPDDPFALEPPGPWMVRIPLAEQDETALGLTQSGNQPATVRVEFFAPAGQPPPRGWPLALILPGGGWSSGDPLRFRAAVNPLRARELAVGLVALTPGRVDRPAWPRRLAEGRAVLRWVRERSVRVEVGAGDSADPPLFDPARVAVLGFGTGGHLAVFLGAEAGRLEPEARPNAVVAFAPPVDLTPQAIGPTGPPLEPLLGRHASLEARMDASPLGRLNAESAPLLLIHGGEDRHVPPDQTARLEARARELGVRVERIVIPRGRHGLGVVWGTDDFSGRIRDFLELNAAYH